MRPYQDQIGRHRPPWWPENEPWPPQGGLPQRIRNRFLLRLTIALGVFLAIVVAGCTAAFWGIVLLTGGDAASHGGPGMMRLLGPFLLVIVVIGVVAATSIRRFAIPVSVWLEAAGRVESGDYTARVPERGPSELRQVAVAFNAMTARLEQNEADRRRLLADVTHELRTPLTVIQGQIEAMLDGIYPPDAAHLTPLLDETQVLGRLIDDLRTLALAETGALKLNREPTDVAVLAGEAVAALRRPADTAGVTLAVSIADEVPVLTVDPVRIREVLTNLITNALRYTPKGGTVTVLGCVEDGRARFAVRDTGTGIDPAMLPHIFDRFYRSSDSRGSGLGLSIAKDLITAHGGEVGATSVADVGTEVWFTLPLDDDHS